MIVLRANSELRQTFEKLIQTMKVPVAWNGLFVVIDNYIILQGEVRSLYFHFDTKKVVTNILDIPIKEDEIENTAGNVRVQNAINIILYVFGKWGTVKGLRVGKNYAQLNQLFKEIMREIQVEPEYTGDYFRFYKSGIRITYEEVIEAALAPVEEIAPETEEEGGGLWHKLVWNMARANFMRMETTLLERRKGRLGNNFYLVGYLCPVCREKLYMVVYPVGREQRIETEEGGVLLARACACDHCNSFYTPRPGKLLAEGDVYTMQFGDDRKAYEDYLELLGRTGERVSNCKCNEYVDKRRSAEEEQEEPEETLEEVCENLPYYSEEEYKRLAERMEEGFYPDESIVKCEEKVMQFRGNRSKKGRGREDGGRGSLSESGGKATAHAMHERSEGKVNHAMSSASQRNGRQSDSRAVGESEEKAGGKNVGAGDEGKGNSTTGFASEKGEGKDYSAENHHSARGESGETPAPEIFVNQKESEEVQKKYEARMNVMDRFSERQLRELKNQLKNENRLETAVRQRYLDQVNEKLDREQIARLTRKVDSCEEKNYAILKRVAEEVEHEDIPQHMKQPLLEKLGNWKKQRGGEEVRQLVAKMSPNMDRAQYRRFMERIHEYEDVDLTPYEEKLRASREAAEKQEIANIVRRSRTDTREELSELADKLQTGDFLPELVRPYLDKVENKIREADEKAIAQICEDPLHMSFEEGMEAYEKIQQGEFLPELKNNVLQMLSKRLSKIKTDESELLVKKLQEELQEAGIGENRRHYFYPARKVLLNQAAPEETAVIDFAVASYAAGRGLFEYPIFVADTSRNESGKEGMILTPDHLYYSTMLTAYGVKVSSIEKITASTGLLNKGIYVHQKNGGKLKIPYAVEGKELHAYAKVLDSFIHYLQEKPDSRSVNYLAKEKHETICCFRCGYVYKGGNVCPKCGYKNNG